MTASFALSDERPQDAQTIRAVVDAAFLHAPHRSGTEGAIVTALRAAGALTVSLVALRGDEDIADDLLGHIAFSPIFIDDRDHGWLALGPLAVRPDVQGQGIGSALAREGLARARRLGARGCLVVGEPAYYGRFGFVADAGLVMPGIPPQYVQALPFGPECPAGVVTHHAAFSAQA